MRMYDIISKKKKSLPLDKDEIDFFIKGYTAGTVPDYQASSLLMAICLCGMNDEETYNLTAAIASSGDSVDLSIFGELSADKHSTGGVGDKTTLIVAPLAASLGCKVAKMSGRGLGHTGGTIDKLEAITGYKTVLTPTAFMKQVEKLGVAVIGQSGNLAPSDKKLYALRDVTATVDSIPLITSSIMGKKLAAGAHSIVLDVKCGSGAFMKTPGDAEVLAKSMVKIGKMCKRKTMALITDMDTPLGFSIGNILEVKEAVAVLSGGGPSDLREICLALASSMASLSLKISMEKAERRAEDALASGAALLKFKEWISTQGGDVALIENTALFPCAEYVHEIKASEDGFISKMDAEKIGTAAMKLGAGRAAKEDKIDYTAGVVLAKKTGDALKSGDTVATIHTNKKASINEAEELLRSAITLSKQRPESKPLIYKVIS